MDAHPDREAEHLLQALLTGAVDEHDVEVQSQFATRPGLRERFEQLQHLASDLDEVGADDRARLAEDLSRPSRLDAAVREFVARQRGPGRRLSRWAGAAAAVLVAGLLLWWLVRPHAADDNTTLGPGAQELQSPQGPVRAYERFTWRLPLPPDCTYAIIFRDTHGKELFRCENLAASGNLETTWVPEDKYLRLMEPRMTWEVESQDLNHNTKRSLGPVEVSLLPR